MAPSAPALLPALPSPTVLAALLLLPAPAAVACTAGVLAGLEGPACLRIMITGAGMAAAGGGGGALALTRMGGCGAKARSMMALHALTRS